MRITVVFFALYGAAGTWFGVRWAAWPVIATGVLALMASVSTARSRPWSRFLVYALTAMFVWNLGYSLYAAVRANYFELYGWWQIVVAQGIQCALAGIAGLCSYISYRHFRQGTWAKAD